MKVFSQQEVAEIVFRSDLADWCFKANMPLMLRFYFGPGYRLYGPYLVRTKPNRLVPVGPRLAKKLCLIDPKWEVGTDALAERDLEDFCCTLSCDENSVPPSYLRSNG